MGIFTCSTYAYGIVIARNCSIYLQIFPQFLNIIGKMVRTLVFAIGSNLDFAQNRNENAIFNFMPICFPRRETSTEKHARNDRTYLCVIYINHFKYRCILRKRSRFLRKKRDSFFVVFSMQIFFVHSTCSIKRKNDFILYRRKLNLINDVCVL